MARSSLTIWEWVAFPFQLAAAAPFITWAVVLGAVDKILQKREQTDHSAKLQNDLAMGATMPDGLLSPEKAEQLKAELAAVVDRYTDRPVPAPFIDSFVAEPKTVERGQEVVLSWHVTGAVRLTLGNLEMDPAKYLPMGMITVKPTETLPWGLTAYNADGVAAGSIITVTVTEPPPDYVPAPLPATVPGPHDVFPVLGKDFTVWSLPNGTLSKTPESGDKLVIDHDVTLTEPLTARAITVRGGTFRNDAEVKVKDFLVMESGAWDQRATLTVADVPIDLAADPQQYGTGAIVLGKHRVNGQPRTPFVRLITEPKAGDTVLMLSEPVTGWQVGDRLILPDSRSPNSGVKINQWELLTIKSMGADNHSIHLTAPLTYAHPGAKDCNSDVGNPEFFPHVANLTRDVVIRSENPSGTRGHVMFSMKAQPELRGVEFRDLGRTTNELTGTTNRKGRYAGPHFHHLTDLPGEGPRFTLDGCSIWNTTEGHNRRWAVVVHDSRRGLVRGNVLYNAVGAAVMTETGTERDNLFEGNFVCRVAGKGGRAPDVAGTAKDWGREGVGFWCGSYSDLYRNNVVCNVAGGEHYAFTFHPLQEIEKTKPIAEFVGNEVYACARGLTAWHLGANNPDVGRSYVADFKVWHCGWGTFTYPGRRITYLRPKVRGDWKVLTGIHTNNQGIAGVDYLCQEYEVIDPDIQGCRYGIYSPHKVGDTAQHGDAVMPFTIQGGYLANYHNVYMQTMGAVSGGKEQLTARRVFLTGTRFAQPNVPDHTGNPKTNVKLRFSPPPGGNNNWVRLDEVAVTDYDGVPGDNFRILWNESKPDFITPHTQATGIGSPEAGLTNQQNWDKYKLSVAGQVAPANATTRERIQGLVVQNAPRPNSSSSGPGSAGR